MHLSIQDTKVLKGIALLLLLFHHLFYVNNGLFDDIQLNANHYLVNDLGKCAKLCVAIFVFLSGYGLCHNAEKHGIELKKYYWRRFTKLYLNFWFVFLIFVPISVCFFNYPLEQAYGEHVVFKLILDFFGVINCFGWFGYNPTWWFYSAIIVLYVSFPLLYRMVSTDKTMLAVFACVLIYFIPIGALTGVKSYFPSFLLGILYCRFNNSFKITVSPIFLLLVFFLFFLERLFVGDQLLYDAFLVLVGVTCYVNFGSGDSKIHKVLAFLGEHSMNIFLFHTFIFHFWFQEQLYSLRNPIAIYVALLGACLLISLALQLIKRLVHYDSLLNKIASVL